jgi:UrcA family protein
MRSIITTLVLAAAMTPLAGVAAAKPQTIRVPVSQADLQSSETLATLYERVEDAAEEVCHIENRAAAMTQASCMRQVIHAALANAEIAPLSDYAAAHESGHATPIEVASR